MTKRELIQRICQLDPGAKAELLARCSEDELKDYLGYLEELPASGRLAEDSVRWEKVRVVRAFLAAGLYPDYEEAPHVSETILGGNTERARQLLRDLDDCPPRKGTPYENVTFDALRLSLGEIVNQKKSRQRFHSGGGICDIVLPLRIDLLHRYPFWKPWFYRYGIRCVLAEVKNRRGPAGPSEAGQIKRYLDTAGVGRFGMLVNRAGFTREGLKTLHVYATDRQENQALILPISNDDLKELVRRSNNALHVMSFLHEKEIDLLQVA